LQFYKTYCFEDSFLEKIKWALTKAGLPSRGNSTKLDKIQPPEAQVKTINGFDLEYMDVGSGIPIVFVHGALSDYRAWNHYQNPISENYRYISYSMRYAGSQPWPDSGEKVGLATDAQDLIALIEALELGPVFTVSWSGGGKVSGLAALLRPDLFQGNVHFEPIVNTLADTKDPMVLQSKGALFSRYGEVFKEYAAGNNERGNELFLETVFELDPGQFNTEIMPLRAMNRDSARYMRLRLSASSQSDLLNCERLGATEVPTLVVVGEKTNAWWQHLVKRYHDCIPGSQFKVMNGVNHDGPIRDPLQLTEIILGYVESIAK